MPSDRAQARLGRQEMRAPEHGSSDIGRILEHAADGGRIPARQTSAGAAAGFGQPTTDLMQADPFQADPGEDLPHDPGFVFDHLEPCHPTADGPGDVAIAEGSRAEGTHQARAGGMAAPAPAALEDLGALILGDHTLDLQEQVILGTAANGAVEEHHLHTRAAELLDQEHLVGVAPGQTIRGMNVEAIDNASCHCIAQPLQGWTEQAGAAVALVEEDMLGLEPRIVGHDPFVQAGDLAGDGAVVRLLVARHSGIQRGLGITHVYLPGPAECGPPRQKEWCSRPPAPCSAWWAPDTRRPQSGTGC